MMKYFLTIDRGQSNIKAALHDTDANVLSVVSQQSQPIQHLHSGWAEQDMDLIWDHTVLAIRKLLLQYPVEVKDISAVSFSGQGGGVFLVGKDGKQLRAGILSLDNRHEEIINLVQNPQNIGIPKTILVLRWLKEYENDTYSKIRWVFGSKDWIRFKLTGAANADMSDTAAPTEHESTGYNYDSLKTAGVQECFACLPELKYATEICGTITADAAFQTGLAAGTPVVAGAHDMIACSIGVGGNRQGHLAIILGTTGIGIAVVDEKTTLPENDGTGHWFTFAGIKPGQRMITCSIGSCGKTINWFLDLFFQAELNEAKKRKISIFRYLEEILPQDKISKIIFQPYLLGTFYNSSASASLMGITADTTREDMLIALFQGICISMFMEVERLEAILGKFNDIWIVGGGAKNRIWGQLFADVMNTKVHTCVSEEVGCRGAAICAGVGLGQYGSSDNLPAPEIKEVFTPNPENVQHFAEQTKVYHTAYASNEKFWDEHKKL